MIIGLTGSFGTGKTTVANFFKRLGAKVIDADRFAHASFKRDSRVYKKVTAVFGDWVLDRRRNIDRRRLAGVVFKDQAHLKRLCGIIHPYVIGRIRRELKRQAKRTVVVIDAPLLIETGLDRMADMLVVVSATQKNQIRRCKAKFKMATSEILARIRSQMPLKAKVARADFVIYNNGELNDTRKQVKNVWRRILWT